MLLLTHTTDTASCHCQAFTYTITASPPLSSPSAEIMECNCSICTRNGYLFIYVPDAAVKFTKGDLSEFRVRYPFPYPICASSFPSPV
jgi:hypothetical protein